MGKKNKGSRDSSQSGKKLTKKEKKAQNHLKLMQGKNSNIPVLENDKKKAA